MRYLGSPPAFRALMAAGFDLRAVVMPAPRGTAPLTTLPPLLPSASAGKIRLLTAPTLTGEEAERHVDDLARTAGIPVFLVPSLAHPAAIAAIAACEPDVIAVSCFPLRIPPALLDLPRYGCVNVHPSLLPKGRGAEPVFWTIRNGEAETGVTIHLMDTEFDSGPILVQERVAVPEGIRLPDLERQLAELGGRLLVQAIEGLISGRIVPQPQDDRLATLAPTPADDDYLVRTDHPARWAYNFIRAVAPLDGPPTLHVVATGEWIPLRDALAYDPGAHQAVPVERHGDILAVQFSPGVAQVQAAQQRKENGESFPSSSTHGHRMNLGVSWESR
jgi:methionyl-tRNA formyltransferase